MGLEFYLGIDESNHGKYPEYYVAVYSPFLSDIAKTTGLPKQRRRRTVESFLGQRDFRYFEITERYKESIGSYHATRIIALSRLINSFDNLGTVFIDGDLNSEVIEEIERVLYPSAIPKIETGPRGDTTILLVNMADALANILYRHSASRGNTVLFPDKRIAEPPLRDYAMLLG